jgi:hypothetical protein
MKFTISEEEKKHIRLLYEQSEVDTLVYRKNPFKDKNIIIKDWDENLKDGDLYFEWAPGTKEWFKLEIENLLKGKTFRNGDKVFKIEGLKDGTEHIRLEKNLEWIKFNGPIQTFFLKTTPDSSSMIAMDPRRRFNQPWIENIVKYLYDNLPKNNELPDSLFKIMKVVKEKTDFTP